MIEWENVEVRELAACKRSVSRIIIKYIILLWRADLHLKPSTEPHMSIILP